MPAVRYGQFLGGLCVGIISFDPDVTSVAEMEGALNATLLPIATTGDGQWGVGATWDGLDIQQAGTAGLDPIQVTDTVTELQTQIDNLTDVLASTVATTMTQSLTATTGTGGQVTVTWPQPFSGVPQVAAIARNSSANNYTINVELLAVSATGATVRAWRLTSSTAATLTNASVNIIAFGAA